MVMVAFFEAARAEKNNLSSKNDTIMSEIYKDRFFTIKIQTSPVLPRDLSSVLPSTLAVESAVFGITELKVVRRVTFGEAKTNKQNLTEQLNMPAI